VNEEGDPWEDEASGIGVFSFIIRGFTDREFGLRDEQLAEALRPKDRPASVISWARNEIEVDGVRIMFSAEPPGWMVSFLNPPSEAWALEVASSIRDQMAEVGGQAGEISLLSRPE